MKKITVLSLFLIVILYGCVQDSSIDPLTELTKTQKEEQIQEAEITLSDEEFYAYVQSIPTPLQSTSLMQAIGVEFNANLMLDRDESDKKNSWFGQSVTLGIYGADLGYANVYGETGKSMLYLGTIRSLADKLKIGQFFDINAVKDLIEQKDNVDELINVSQMNFQKMNDYLQNQNRGKVSVAMILGGWVEGLYLSTNAASADTANTILHEIVSEQKFTLETIDLLLQMYSTDKYFLQFKEGFTPVISAFDGVKTVYTEGEIIQREDENGNLVVEDTSTSEIIFTVDDLHKITKAVNELRNKLLSIN